MNAFVKKETIHGARECNVQNKAVDLNILSMHGANKITTTTINNNTSPQLKSFKNTVSS